LGTQNHYLGPLVQHYGSEEAALRAMEDEVSKAYQDGRLVTDTHRVYQQAFDFGGYSVVIKGRVINGHVHIGTAWGAPPSGWSIVLPELKRGSSRLVDSIFLPLLNSGG
jgi:hypothetical protein